MCKCLPQAFIPQTKISLLYMPVKQVAIYKLMKHLPNGKADMSWRCYLTLVKKFYVEIYITFKLLDLTKFLGFLGLVMDSNHYSVPAGLGLCFRVRAEIGLVLVSPLTTLLIDQWFWFKMLVS